MNRFDPATRAYARPMTGWWRKNPFFIRYMLREGSAVFLAAYALVLLAGLFCLALGEAAYEAWRAAMASPLFLLFHAAALIIVSYHAVTWFKVMPKTAPDLPVNPKLITASALILSAVVSLSILWWAAR